MDCSGVDYCDAFISSLDSHSDGTHSLQWIYWRESDIMLHFSILMKKQSHFGWPDGESIWFLGELILESLIFYLLDKIGNLMNLNNILCF